MALHYSGVGYPYAHATGIFYLVGLVVLILWSLSIFSFYAALVLGIARFFKSSCYIFGATVSTRWWPNLSLLLVKEHMNVLAHHLHPHLCCLLHAPS